MEDSKYILTNEQRLTLLGYFYKRPYAEVARGVEMLEKLPVLDDTAKKEPHVASKE